MSRVRTKTHLMVLSTPVPPIFSSRRFPRRHRWLHPKCDGAHHAPGAVLRHISPRPSKRLSWPYWKPPRRRFFLFLFTCGRSRAKGKRRTQQANGDRAATRAVGRREPGEGCCYVFRVQVPIQVCGAGYVFIG